MFEWSSQGKTSYVWTLVGYSKHFGCSCFSSHTKKIITTYNVLFAGDTAFLLLNCLALTYLETVMSLTWNLSVACAIVR